MRKVLSLKGKNDGASLLAVIVALIFVGVLGIVITNITIMNIQMKEVEQSGKKNFYNAESVVNTVKSGLSDKAAEAMEKAYVEVLSEYRDITIDSKDIQEQFKRQYMEKLIETFAVDVAVEAPQISESDRPEGRVKVYQSGKYKTDILKQCVDYDNKDDVNYINTTADKAGYDADYDEGIFTLKNIEVKYKDSRDYETTLRTNMVFKTPKIADGTNVAIHDFMKYALIADKNIDVAVSNLTVNGNVYAGKDGISANYVGASKFTNGDIVTRGDIVLKGNTDLTLGGSSSKIWAENILTDKGSSGAKLNINGACYVADDLSLNGKESDVNIDGQYFGFNFRHDYVASATDILPHNTAEYNSAIMINGKDCRLDMSDVNHLYLAGKTFITRGSSNEKNPNKDIELGESISVRSNQLAYYVNKKFLDLTDPDHPVFATEEVEEKQGEAVVKKTVEKGAEEFAKYAFGGEVTAASLYEYIDKNDPVQPYYYKELGVSEPKVCYYLKFRKTGTEDYANKFYMDFYKNNKEKINAMGRTYAKYDVSSAEGDNAFVVSDSCMLTLRGDILYRKDKNSAELDEKNVKISNENWKGAEDIANAGIYWRYSDRIAKRYKSMQTYLCPSDSRVKSDNVRFEGDDKSKESVFEYLLDVQKDGDGNAVTDVNGNRRFENKIEIKYTDEGGLPSGRVIKVVSTDYDQLPEDKEGIIIATGNVTMHRDFKGLVISGKQINLWAGVTIQADPQLVADMLSEELAKKDADGNNNSEIIKILKAYTEEGGFSGKLGQINVEDYIEYENWTKNE